MRRMTAASPPATPQVLTLKQVKLTAAHTRRPTLSACSGLQQVTARQSYGGGLCNAICHGLQCLRKSRDTHFTSPAGYNIVDVLVGGSQGHAIGIGAILGLKAIGAL